MDFIIKLCLGLDMKKINGGVCVITSNLENKGPTLYGLITIDHVN